MRLFALFPFHGFDFILIANLATLFQSGGNAQFGQDNGLKKNPHAYYCSKPQEFHGHTS
jgi:hypothetical protein